MLTEEAPARIADLVELGVEFDDDLGREGGHSLRRVVHAGGAETGKAISAVLADRVREHPRITSSRTSSVLVALGGAAAAASASSPTAARSPRPRRCSRPAATRRSGSARRTRRARSARGSCSPTAPAPRSPTSSSSSSIRPRSLDDGFLLSEALRGEGALLVDDHGDRFTDELAPRDVVARAIAERGHAGLDLRAIERGRFPGLMATLERAGYDPAVEPIPVSPAAHYTVGGIVTDLDGAHHACPASTPPASAPRPASTARTGSRRTRCSSASSSAAGPRSPRSAPSRSPVAGPPPVALRRSRRSRAELRRALWEDAGVIRSAEGLERLRDARRRCCRASSPRARSRARESRGGHFRSDFPTEDDAFAGHVVLRRGHEPVLEPWS